MSKHLKLPEELCCNPTPFIVLTGLDNVYNAVHKSIWDAFCNNRRNDRLQIQFSCLPGDHAYPRSKTKRTSYDWYIPKGLLKSSWMKKHLSLLPSVVVVFFELDWDDPAWKERHLACASRVQVVRSSLQGRTTKVAVVLIQKSTPLPPGEDMVAAERAAALCSACELSAKSLFILPHTDQLLGYIIRLENAFYELSQVYYRTEARRVKAHKEFLNKTTHQLLFPRHQFKIGFFNEMIQDPTSALKHYRHAYTHVHELRTYESNNLEIKLVGGFVNYKICKLCFLKLNAPLDAITQFRQHVEQFKSMCGSQDLLFEHSAWLSHQYQVFADLFSEAISKGLSAIQTQHPGFYYNQAAYYAKIRKQCAQKLKASLQDQTYPSEDPLKVEVLEFYGQRPWRQGQQRIDPADHSKEKDGIMALQLEETKQDHSLQIISLLGSAISIFKNYHCHRLKRQLTVQMGEEYYHAGDYMKVVALLTRATADYRTGRCWLILSKILWMLLHCSYLTADLESFLIHSTQLLSRHLSIPHDDKITVQHSLMNLLMRQIPLPILLPASFDHVPEHHTSAYNDAEEKWKTLLSSPKSFPVYSLQVTDAIPFVECKFQFSKPQFTMEEVIALHVFTRVTCPAPCKISKLLVLLNNGTELSVEENAEKDAKKSDLKQYTPFEIKEHVLKFLCSPHEKQNVLEVRQLSVLLGSSNGLSIDLIWSDQFVDAATDPKPSSPFSMAQLGGEKCWDDISNITSTEIVECPSRLKVNILHKTPAFVGEAYAIDIKINSSESNDFTAENVTAVLSLKQNENSETEAHLSEKCSDLHTSKAKSLQLALGNMETNQTIERTVYVQTTQASVLHFSLHVSYQMQKPSELPKTGVLTCTSSESIDFAVEVLTPFNFTAHVTSLNLDSVSTVNQNQPFIVLVNVSSENFSPIQINSFSLHLNENDGFKTAGEQSPALDGKVLQQRECAVGAFTVLCDKSHDPSTSFLIGSCTFEWSRFESENPAQKVTLQRKLPSILVKSSPVSITAAVPAFGHLRQKLTITYSLKSHISEPQTIEISCEGSDAFMFSGTKNSTGFLAPGEAHNYSYNFFPLAIGYQELPRFMVSCTKHAEDEKAAQKVDQYPQNRFIFVKPLTEKQL
nr:trafficking protein particle complex subunit 11-like [Ciona intestinalis]|eukprot:XP_002122142.1 trafficking protein particle complex subunit 11-like [Ciona intestinalis]